MPGTKLLDLPSDLLGAIARAGGPKAIQSLLATSRRLNSLLRPQLQAAWLRRAAAAAADRALTLLRPSRFAGLRSLALHSDRALTCDLERLQLPELESLQLENILFASFGFNDIAHLSALTSLSVDTYACGCSAGLGRDGTLGALQALTRLECLTLSNLASDHGLQHLASVTQLRFMMLNHSYGSPDDTDEEASPRVDTECCVIGRRIGAMPRLQILVASTGDGAGMVLNSYFNELKVVGSAGHSVLRELWMCGPILPLLSLTDARSDPILELPDFFDAHPHLHFIHWSSTAHITQPAGHMPALGPSVQTVPAVTDGNGRRIRQLDQQVNTSDGLLIRYVRDL